MPAGIPPSVGGFETPHTATPKTQIFGNRPLLS